MGYKLSDVADSLSFSAFAERGLKIITTKGELIWLAINFVQKKVHSVIERQRQAGYPMRAIILKARRLGVSTYFAARYFREINRRAMRYACTCSADIDATDKVFKMVNLFQDEIPSDMKRPTDYSNRKEIIYSAPHRSQFLCQTAGKDVLGRGGLTHYLHATEFAWWGRAKEQLGGAAQEIPDDVETCIAIESTGNGVGGAFYDMFVEAVERHNRTKNLDGYVPIFLPWFIFADYRKPLEHGWQATSEELEIQQQFTLDLEQLAWRRWAIDNKCQGDLNLFHQEYPATWLEAFQASGQPVFSPAMLKYQNLYVRDDIQWGLFDSRTGDFMPGPKGVGWQVLDLGGDHDHTIGTDTAEYRLSDERDAQSQRDYDAAVVLDRSNKHVKAILKARMAQVEFGCQVLGAAKHYNGAWIVPEIPAGMGVLQVLKDAQWEHIYSRQTGQERYDVQDADELGWRTTSTTRHWLVNDLISALRSNSILCQFQDILDEMRTFIYDKTGKPIHIPGKHDDLIFGLGLALQGDLNCPRNLALEIPERTGGDESARPPRTYRDLATAGIVDDFDEEDAEDQDHTW